MNSSHVFPVRVYYEDTDFSGNVYHATYLKFMERGRTEWLRERGVHHSELAKEGLGFVVRHMDVWYDQPAKIDDELKVKTRVKQMRGARLVLSQSVLRNGETVARAEVEVVLVSSAGRPTRLPQIVRARLSV